MMLTIGKLAAAGGVGVETIRFYQRKGLLDQPTRDGGIRRYGTDDVRRLQFIRQAQAAGFTLAEIKDWTFILGPGWVVGVGNGRDDVGRVQGGGHSAPTRGSTRAYTSSSSRLTASTTKASTRNVASSTG